MTNVGINLTDQFSGDLGIGVSARSMAASPLKCGTALSIADVALGSGRHDRSSEFLVHAVEHFSQLPDAINLLILPPFVRAEELTGDGEVTPPLLGEGAVNATFTISELPDMPRSWARSLETLDPVTGTSDVVEAALDFLLSDAAVVHCLQAMQLPAVVRADRRLMFVKSWNEWAEGHHLGPDLKHDRTHPDPFRDAIWGRLPT